jgi:hypothetical protein
MIDIDIDASFLGSSVAKLGGDLRIVSIHDAAADQLDHIGAFAVEQRFAGSQLLEFGTAPSDRRLAASLPPPFAPAAERWTLMLVGSIATDPHAPR